MEFLRSQEKTKDIPTYVLTNYAEKALATMGMGVEKEKYIIKADYLPKEIVKIVEERLKGKR